MKEIFLICGAIVSIFATIAFVVGGGYLVFTLIKDDIRTRKEAAEEYALEKAQNLVDKDEFLKKVRIYLINKGKFTNSTECDDFDNAMKGDEL
jgi:hypothetical protein